MQLNELRDYIGSLLEIRRFRDYSPNGLQIEGRTEVLRIATAVSASQQVLKEATDWGADALIAHHGYFWRNEDACITGLKKQRIELFLQHNVSLLAYHLPLDAHPELGNNAQLAKRLGWQEQGRFGEQDIACHGLLSQEMTVPQVATHLTGKLNRIPLVIGDVSKKLKRVAWCSGGAQSYFEQAILLGVDVFVTGEISEQNVHMARESGVVFIAAGHHATERYGVSALGEHLSAQFDIEHQFIDQDNPV